MKTVRAIFLKIRQDVAAAYPGFTCGLSVGQASEFPHKRNYAYCVSENPAEIVIAPKMSKAPRARIEGVLAHEIAGHALLFFLGDDAHSERDADRTAEKVLGIRISYDKDLVQTTGSGIRPRPAALG